MSADEALNEFMKFVWLCYKHKAEKTVRPNDGSLNFRIAVALASIGRSGDVGGLRANLSPVDPMKPWLWATGAGMTAWKGNSLADRMVCALKRCPCTT